MMAPVATASAVSPHPTQAHQAANRPNMVSVGTIVWLSSELMFFAALFAMYFTVRSVNGPEAWAEGTDLLNVPFAAANTTDPRALVGHLPARGVRRGAR